MKTVIAIGGLNDSLKGLALISYDEED